MEIVPPVVMDKLLGLVIAVTLLMGLLPMLRNEVRYRPLTGWMVMELVEMRAATLLMLLFVTLIPPVALSWIDPPTCVIVVPD
jgi:hypothetical protein